MYVIFLLTCSLSKVLTYVRFIECNKFNSIQFSLIEVFFFLIVAKKSVMSVFKHEYLR